jgi:plastocyanin
MRPATRRSLRVLVASCLLAPLAAAVPTPAGARAAATRPATGRIEGEVLISSALASRRPRFRIYDQPGPGSRPPAVETNEIHNVVLYLKDAPVPPGAEPKAGRIEQVDEQFSPHVLPVLRGATVAFPNLDIVFHNVFSLSSARELDLGRYPRGSSKSVTFDRAGIVQLFCHIHSNMSAVVLVLENPFFAVPTRAGRYTIDDVPPGDYTVIGWHERIQPVQRTVHVVAGQTARVDFNIPIPPSEQPAR